MPPPTVTLLTDFGHQDPYVGIMKGVIASRCPEARVIDLCHEVAPQNVAQASYLLQTSYRYFSEKTVHVAVVDPGVGSERRVICAQFCGQTFVAPDNGLLWPLVEETPADRIVNVTNASHFLGEVSSTFHGRDIFAPVAAALASGVSAEELGPCIQSIQRSDFAGPTIDSDGVAAGVVVHVDRFGNLITNFTEPWLREQFADLSSIEVWVGHRMVRGMSRAYADVAPGHCIALFGSTGRLEISVNLGSAAKTLEAGIGAAVTVKQERK